MEGDREPLDEATPHPKASVPMGSLVRGLGLLLLAGGIAYAALGKFAYNYTNSTQILTGWVICGFGLLVAILGQILHAVETRR